MNTLIQKVEDSILSLTAEEFQEVVNTKWPLANLAMQSGNAYALWSEKIKPLRARLREFAMSAQNAPHEDTTPYFDDESPADQKRKNTNKDGN